MILQNQKILLMGLGILGGGVATAKFLVEQGARLTVTDLKNELQLAPSLKNLQAIKSEINFVLGKHREKDFLENDIIVINPDVPADNYFVTIARKAGKRIENELTLFYELSKSKNLVAITGTRGKTTTANWITHLLKSKNPDVVLLGNAPDKPFLQEIKKVGKDSIVVMEVPSYQLEIINENNFRSKVSVITNIYRDHINRHKTLEGYALTKANIFRGQKNEDVLILNKNNQWTPFLLNQKPKSKVLFFSEEDFTVDQKEFVKQWGKHNLQNFTAASLAASALGVPAETIKKRIGSLPQIKFRQEKIYDNGTLQIYNDTAATSPEAAMAAMIRFLPYSNNVIFIGGGTDKELEYKSWAETVKKMIKPGNLILLAGSATEKMKIELGGFNFKEFESLEECLKKALAMHPTKIIFSPGAKSFEKFKNEFDRGEQFNLLVTQLAK